LSSAQRAPGRRPSLAAISQSPLVRCAPPRPTPSQPDSAATAYPDRARYDRMRLRRWRGALQPKVAAKGWPESDETVARPRRSHRRTAESFRAVETRRFAELRRYAGGLPVSQKTIRQGLHCDPLKSVERRLGGRSGSMYRLHLDRPGCRSSTRGGRRGIGALRSTTRATLTGDSGSTHVGASTIPLSVVRYEGRWESSGAWHVRSRCGCGCVSNLVSARAYDRVPLRRCGPCHFAA